MSFYALAVIYAAAFTFAVAQELPVQTCKHDSPDYSSCLRLAIQESWPNFIKGIPELDIPALDPYYTENQRNVFETNDMKADITVSKTNTYGLAKTRFLAVRPYYSEDFYKLEVDVEIPKIFIEGDYKAEGKMSSFQMDGEGQFNISMEDIKALWSLEGPVANDRWTIEHFKLSPEIGKLKVWFSNMFKGNEDLNNAAVDFVNKHWPTLYRTMLPFAAQMWDDHLTELSNRVLSKVSFSKTFP